MSYRAAFNGLQNDLIELKLGCSNSIRTDFNQSLVSYLDNLHTLVLEHCTFLQDYMGDGGGSLSDLLELKSLTLYDNSLTYFQERSLPSHLTSLTLQKQSFGSVPVELLRSLQSLDYLAIKETNVNHIGANVFQLHSQLSTIDLTNNKINTLEVGCFNGVGSVLSSLILNGNAINLETNIAEIKTLTNLGTLDLSSNTLTSISSNPVFLTNKGSLESLHLGNNSLTSLGNSAFNGLISLRTLELNNNLLNTIPDNVFQGLSGLTSLNIKSLTSSSTFNPPSSLKSLTSLQTLDMSDVNLDQVQTWSVVSSLISLQSLILKNTQLTGITNHALQNLTQLNSLHLDNNRFARVTQGMLTGATNLQQLYLNGNQISSVEECAFYLFAFKSDPSKKLNLQLADNQLQCDCDLEWLLKDIQDGKVEIEGTEKCANRNNQLLSSFSPGEFCISNPTQPVCSDYYSTVAPPTVTTPPTHVITVNLVSKTHESIFINWTVSTNPTVTNFRVKYIHLQSSQTFYSKILPSTQDQFEIGSLIAGNSYSVCVIVNPPDGAEKCIPVITDNDDGNSGGNTGGDTGDDSSDTGIIVGVVVGCVLLVIIVLAIVYFVMKGRRKKQPAKPMVLVQPHTFSASELPSMGSHSRQFSRPPSSENGAVGGAPEHTDPKMRNKGQPKVGRALDEAIKVTVISDGKSNPNMNRVSGASAGSYQYLDEKHINPNPNLSPTKGAAYYSQDAGARALPSYPGKGEGRRDMTPGKGANPGYVQQGQGPNSGYMHPDQKGPPSSPTKSDSGMHSPRNKGGGNAAYMNMGYKDAELHSPNSSGGYKNMGYRKDSESEDPPSYNQARHL